MIQRNEAVGKNKANERKRTIGAIGTSKTVSATVGTSKANEKDERKNAIGASRTSRVTDKTSRVINNTSKVTDGTSRVTDGTSRVTDKTSRVTDNTVGNNTVGNNTVVNNTAGNNTVGNNTVTGKTADQPSKKFANIRILSKIGTGTFGDVYAFSDGNGRQLALKIEKKNCNLLRNEYGIYKALNECDGMGRMSDRWDGGVDRMSDRWDRVDRRDDRWDGGVGRMSDRRDGRRDGVGDRRDGRRVSRDNRMSGHSYDQSGTQSGTQSSTQSGTQSSKYVCRVYFYGRLLINNTPTHAMIMDLLGLSLQKLFVRNNRRMAESVVMRVGVMMVDCLEYVHERGYVHRDVKPDNFVFGRGDDECRGCDDDDECRRCGECGDGCRTERKTDRGRTERGGECHECNECNECSKSGNECIKCNECSKCNKSDSKCSKSDGDESGKACACLPRSNLYLIDLGLSKRYRPTHRPWHSPSHSLDPPAKPRSLLGTARYASLNVHRGHSQSRRDDLESMAYSLLFLAKGRLPWQGLKARTREEKHALIMGVKESTAVDVLCGGLHGCFYGVVVYVRGLGYGDRPDYGYVRGLFEDGLYEMGEL